MVWLHKRAATLKGRQRTVSHGILLDESVPELALIVVYSHPCAVLDKVTMAQSSLPGIRLLFRELWPEGMDRVSRRRIIFYKKNLNVCSLPRQTIKKNNTKNIPQSRKLIHPFPHLSLHSLCDIHQPSSSPTTLSVRNMSSHVPKLYMLNRNYSSWSLRAWLAMRALNVEFEPEVLLVGTKEIPDLGLPAADALMRRAGPTSKVPALHVATGSGQTHIVFETLAIIEYLAEGKNLLID